jgi:ATP-binding cassette subfamily F protein uup
MNLISADSISKAFTERWLFNKISFGLSKGEKLALVGSNGTGKSTLLKVISGMTEPDSGQIAKASNIRIGYLAQEPDADPNLTIEQSIFSPENPVLNLVKQYEAAIIDMDFPADKMQEILDKMEQYDAWDFENKAKLILGRLGIHDITQSNASLSGGQRKRVALAKLLITQPDVLILDEPTNHLDLKAIEWLENLLNAHQISLIMVTHDRYFLDNVATQILELEKGKMYVHHGNYAFYLEKKSHREAAMESEISKARNLMKKELEWMRRMPKARGTKSKSRVEAFYDLKEKVQTDNNNKDIEISVQAARLGNKIIEADRIGKTYGDKVLFENFSYIFKKKDRIGVIGQNGTGKSTLLDILTEQLPPDSGSIVHGPTLKIGYYTQHSNNLNNDNRIIDEVKAIAEYIKLGNGETVSVSKLLDMFLFPPSVQHTPISKLSGGERRRLQLLKVLVENPNFLVLDEPTNDLDIDTLNVLEDFLMNFEGCLLLVSHDRYFMDKLVDHLFVFEKNAKIHDFYGNYTDYREQEDNKPEAPKEVETASPKIESQNETNAPKKKLSFKEQRELEELELKIEKLELLKVELTEKLNAGHESHETLMEWSQTLEKTNEELDQCSMRWLELSDV